MGGGRRRATKRSRRESYRAAGGTQARRPETPWVWAGAAVIVVGVLIAYAPAMCGGFIWDDDRYVVDNPTLRTVEGLSRIWFELGATIQYYPLVFTTFWVEYHVWRLEPFGYHLVNVALHALSSVLLWYALRRLSIPGAWFAAAVFALHPVHVESVAWITERKNVLSGVFYLAALLAYLHFARLDAPAQAGSGARRHYLLAMALFACALLSKTVTCTLPAAILLLLWWRRGRAAIRDVLPLIPLFIVGAGMGMLTVWMEKHSVRAAGVDWALSVADRFLVAGRAMCFYVWKLLYPTGLTFSYPRWHIDSGVWWQYLFPLAAVIVMVCLWRLRRRTGNGPLVAILFFSVTLLPALGFVDVYPMRYSFVADHFQYLASIGPIALVVALLTAAVARMTRGGSGSERAAPAPGMSSVGRWMAAGLVLVVLGTLTWRQGRAYSDLEALWRDTLAKNPSAFLAHNNLGSILLDRGNTNEAIGHLAEAVRLKPNFHEAHCNLGRALVKKGRIEEGKKHLAEALEIKPGFARAHNDLGDALAAEGKAEQAIINYRQAVRLQPGFADAHNNLANILARNGRQSEAIEHYTLALRLRPGWSLAHNNLANALAEEGRFDEAVTHYREALRLAPGYAVAHRNLGLALERQGKTDEAIGEYRAALRLRPGDALTHLNLAELFDRRGQVDAAISEYQAALAIDPSHEAAREALEALLVPRRDSERQ
ncbi:MAG: tetratricopeptide repeat protein [Planctomycetota bacterium]|jgi:tetratricopeptide (TPR) repeat protein